MIESTELTTTPYRDTGYDWIAGQVGFAVDPADPANSAVVDLPLAPRDADGRVRFRSDVRILRPREGGNEGGNEGRNEGGNGRLLVVIPNRGLLGGVPFSLGAPPGALMPTEDPDPGDRFLLELGWTVAWCGWQWDVIAGPGRLGLEAPLADTGPGRMRIEFRPDVLQDSHPLSDSSPFFRFRDYPAADPGEPGAELTVRSSPMGPRRTIPRDSWRFEGDSVHLEGGFQPFHWYELVYTCSTAPVVGCGLLAVRDFTSWLRAGHDRAFAFGVSQSGRFLRQFLYDGMNTGEAGGAVFDGVFAHIAGARRGEFNQRFGQPSLTHPLAPGYGPPYDGAGLLEPSRRSGTAPRLFCTNSASEYWRGDGALLHQHPDTGDDLPEDPDVRTYLLSGTDHFGGMAMKDLFPAANPTHRLDAGPVLRALFTRLVAWVCDGVAPPPSAVPRRADGTAVTRQEVVACFAEGAVPDPAHLPWTPHIDPAATDWPLPLGRPAAALVSAVDRAGNEVAGIRLPAVACPVAAYTGWNPRRPVEGLPSVLYEFLGSRLPLPTGTPVPGAAEYDRAATEWAAGMVRDGFLLERDVGLVVEEATRLHEEAGPFGDF